jgi:predicted SAM-dependent methyltransferase
LFEHLTPAEAIVALEEWNTILRPDGVLVLSVPDMAGTIELIKTDPDFAIRHLRGRDGDSVNSHRAWYTAEGLCGLLRYAGFKIEQLQNFHIYPAIVVRAYKLWCSC